MKTVKLLLLSVSFAWTTLSEAQLTINNTFTPAQLVNTVLLPPSSTTSVSNIAFSGVYNVSSRYQVGEFSTATTTLTQMGFSNGIILTSGNTSEIPLALGSDPTAVGQVSRNYVSCTAGEVRKSGTCGVTVNDLNILSGGYNYFNTALLEFDFVAAGTAVAFRYVFGSEEYTDNSGLINYQCSDYNDRFGFLLSGPGVSGGQGYTNDAKNIARTANGSIVSINGVNNGTVGSSGGAPSAAKCVAANPSWVNGMAVAEYFGPIQGTQMNGNTKVLTAYQSGLTIGATYHIKLIVMDVFDGAFDSVVYLEGGSFTTEPSTLPVDLEQFSGMCNVEGIELNWETTAERNNKEFTLEKFSYDKQTFEAIKTLPATGNSGSLHRYSYQDNTASVGNNIYRLSQTDLNGHREELQTIAVNNSCIKSNDFTAGFSANDALNLTYSGFRTQDCNVGLYDLNGQLILQSALEMHQDETIVLPLQKSLATGVYVLKIKTETYSEEIKLINSKF